MDWLYFILYAFGSVGKGLVWLVLFCVANNQQNIAIVNIMQDPGLEVSKRLLSVLFGIVSAKIVAKSKRCFSRMYFTNLVDMKAVSVCLCWTVE